MSRRSWIVTAARARLAVLRPASQRLPWFALPAVLLHLLVVGAFFVRFAPVAMPPPDREASVEIQYVSQAETHEGGSPAPPSPPTPEPTPQAEAPPKAETPTPEAAVPVAPQPDTPPPETAAQATPTPPPPQAKPEPKVNLGDADEDQGALTVTGDNVVETILDPRYRNMPPAYPADAARKREEGVVEMIIHVAPTGVAESVDLVSSSGSPSLDRTALDAVKKWHFTVPIKDGVPIASTFNQTFNFVEH